MQKIYLSSINSWFSSRRACIRTIIRAMYGHHATQLQSLRRPTSEAIWLQIECNRFKIGNTSHCINWCAKIRRSIQWWKPKKPLFESSFFLFRQKEFIDFKQEKKLPPNERKHSILTLSNVVPLIQSNYSLQTYCPIRKFIYFKKKSSYFSFFFPIKSVHQFYFVKKTSFPSIHLSIHRLVFFCK